MKQTCGNCKWSRAPPTSIDPDRLWYDWIVPALPLHLGIARGAPLTAILTRTGVYDTWGNCPTWEAKPVVILEEAKP